MNDIVNIISTVGFPICSCLLYMGYIYKDKQQSREENAKREERFLTTIGDFSTTIEKLTTTLATIDSRLTCIETSLKLEDNEKEN